MASAKAPWRRETELFSSGTEGYHTFRIPSVAVANDGTILAICEGRKDGQDDYEAKALVVKRSTDNGATWGDLQLIVSDPELTMNNPTVVVDRQTGTIWLAYCKTAYYPYVVRSDDSGATWSDPIDLTEQVKLPNWELYDFAPGHGIQMSDCTLVLPADHIEGLRSDAIFSHSHVVVSDDHGATWKLGGSMGSWTNECEVVETQNGSLYMTVRSGKRGHGKRLFSRSEDKGATWSEMGEAEGMIDPGCQASIVRLTDSESGDKDRVLLANIDSTTRENLTLRISYDECQTWPVSTILYSGPAAYSDLAIADDGTAICFYEAGVNGPYETLRLAQFNLEWLTAVSAEPT